MLKRICGMLLAGVMAVSAIPSRAETTPVEFGFETGEEAWTTSAVNGRTVSGFDTETAVSGERSYKFYARTSTAGSNEVSSISKSFDVEYGKYYRFDVWYSTNGYKRLDGETGGAFIGYRCLNEKGTDIEGASYEYYIYADEEEAQGGWHCQSVYIIPTRDTAEVMVTLGLKASVGQVNFDDVSLTEITRSGIGSNPSSTSQSTNEEIPEEYAIGWESGVTDWWRQSVTTGDAVSGTTDTDKHSGERSFRFYSDSDNIDHSNNIVYTNNKQGSYFVVKPGVYELSWWYKIEDYKRFNSSHGMSVTASSYTQDGKENGTGKITKTYLESESGQGWQQSVYTITVPEGSDKIRINIGMRCSKGEYLIDDMVLRPIVTDLVTEPDLENYHGMKVTKVDNDTVSIDLDAEESNSDSILDWVVLGNEESEAAHDLDPGKSAVGYGGLGDTYRQTHPNDPIWVTLKVDPDKMNYITVKLYGSERENLSPQCLMVNDEYGTMQLKYGTVWPIWDYLYTEPAQINSYYYATYRLPMAVTHGKEEVRLQIYHMGDYSAYSANGFSETTEYSRQMYKFITHTDPRYTPQADDKNATTARYDLGAIKVSPNGLSPYDYLVNEMNAGIEEVLKSQNYGPEWEAAVAAGRSPEGATGACLEGTNSMNHGSWENWEKVHYSRCIGSNGENIKGFRTAALSYHREWSNHYHDPEIIDRSVAWLDYYVRAQGSDGAWQNSTTRSWIGGPDRQPSELQMEAGERAIGEVFCELYDEIAAAGYLDDDALMDDDNDPSTPMIPRKQAYITMFKNASNFVFNVMQRRTSVNQDMFCTISGLMFENSLKKLDPSQCMDSEKLKTWIYQSCGLLVAPHDSIQISPKGLSMETHGHLNGAYDGNYGMHGASMIQDLYRFTGDENIRQKSINAANALSYFMETIQNSEGYVAIRKEDTINTRNYKGPGRIEYAAWNNFSAGGWGANASTRGLELFIEYGECYLSSLVDDRQLLYYMMINFDYFGDKIKEASEGYKTFADIQGIDEEAAIVTLAWKGIIEGVNETNFDPNARIDEETFKRWLQNAFGNTTELTYNEVYTRATAAYAIYYKLLDNGVYITKFDLGSGIYLPNEPWNNNKDYVFSDEIAESIAIRRNGEIVRMTLNWRSEYDGTAYEDRCREKATTSEVVRIHEMNDEFTTSANAYMTSPLGLRRVDIAKYGPYVVIMNVSDEEKPCNIAFSSDVNQIYDCVTQQLIDVNEEITMEPLSTIVLDMRTTK